MESVQEAPAKPRRLKLKPRGPVTVELPGGITITARPFGASDIELASHAVRLNLGMAADAAAALARYGIGGPSPTVGADGKAVSVFGVPESLLAIELGCRHIDSWTGVGTDAEDGEDAPAPVDPGFIALLFNAWTPLPVPGEPPSYGRAWYRRMLEFSPMEPGGPKGSAASPGTSTAAAATNAGSAGMPETPAQKDDEA